MERYEIRKEIGKGAFAKVLLAYDKNGIDWTAIREIKLEDVFIDGKNFNLVLELCPLDLKKIIMSQVTLSELHINSYLYMALRGLQVFHSFFMLHRDIKPDNLLIGSDRQLKLADFGLSKSFGHPDPDDTDIVVTLAYRAPELLYGARAYGTAVDIWALGCTLAELFIREELLPGIDEIDQLGKIFYMIGTPDDKVWPNHDKLPKFVEFEATKEPLLKSRFPAVSEIYFDLLKKMLTLDPKKRITLQECFEHPVLKGFKLDVSKLPFEEILGN